MGHPRVRSAHRAMAADPWETQGRSAWRSRSPLPAGSGGPPSRCHQNWPSGLPLRSCPKGGCRLSLQLLSRPFSEPIYQETIWSMASLGSAKGPRCVGVTYRTSPRPESHTGRRFRRAAKTPPSESGSAPCRTGFGCATSWSASPLRQRTVGLGPVGAGERNPMSNS